MNLGIQGKVAIVTGSGRGIGEAIARTLAEEGAKVAIVDVDTEKAESTASTLQAEGHEAYAIPCDVSDMASVDAMTTLCVEKFEGVDILVNNAGFCRDKSILKMQESDWDAVLDTNLKGAWACSKAAIPHLSKGGMGRIVNISSRSHLGNPGQTNYSAAKAGVIGFTKSLAMEQGRRNITVNAVAPGFILTDGMRAIENFEELQAIALAKNTVPRLGTAQDIANMVTFLCSDKTGYINGEVIHVTGGRYSS